MLQYPCSSSIFPLGDRLEQLYNHFQIRCLVHESLPLFSAISVYFSFPIPTSARVRGRPSVRMSASNTSLRLAAGLRSPSPAARPPPSAPTRRRAQQEKLV